MEAEGCYAVLVTNYLDYWRHYPEKSHLQDSCWEYFNCRSTSAAVQSVFDSLRT